MEKTTLEQVIKALDKAVGTLNKQMEEVEKELGLLKGELEGETIRHNEMINGLSSRIKKLESKPQQQTLG